jgi:chlorobactene lauroyltransferase
MLEARKSKLFESVFSIYNRNLLRRKFHSFRVSGLENLKENRAPKIIYANHASFWDGLAAFHISRKLKMDGYVMMEEKHLKKLFLFRQLGAFSVVREKPFEAKKSIDYAVKLLKEKDDRTLWIFPQGEILPNDLRPLKFYKGLSKIVERLGKCFAIPVAFRYEFLNEFKPEIFVRIGEAQFFDGKPENKIADFENKMTVLLDELKSDILNNNFNDFENII